MNKQTTTNNITALNKDVEIIKKHFSHCFDKNGNFDLEKFKNELTKNEIDFSNESYGMDWLGKSYARLLASDEANTLLKEDNKWNDQPQNINSQNLLIKGDNLEVLKHLSSAYYEKVKMIYIDPPYNTGGDGFVYQDDRKFTVEEFKKLAGVDEEKAKRVLDFVNSKSNSHSAWLTFMYPRLYIAKQFLTDDGVIFVSIDGNEVAQLKVLMDEIFGEENFIELVPTIMNLKGNQDKFGFAETHEYFFAYAKSKDKAELNNFILSEDELLDKWDEDEYGLYKEADNLRATGENAPREKRPNLWYPIFLDEGSQVFYVTNDDKSKKETDIKILPINPDGQELSWYWGKKTFNEKKHNLILKKTKNGWQFYRKQRPELGDIPTKKPKSVFYKSDYSTSTATTQLKDLFNAKIFKGPKPVPFIKDLLSIGSSKECVILDFFAGSGTTGDAVMQLNADDRENRKYILVQLAEEIDEKKNKVAYDFVKNELGVEHPIIFDITKERLIRAGKKIQKDNKDLKEPKDLSTVDFGFKIFETTPIWEGYNLEAENFDSQMDLFNENKLSDADLQTLLTTWKTYDGIPLTQNIVEINLDGYIAYYLDTRLYLMNKGFNTKNLKKLLDEIDVNNDFNPRTIIAFGYNFESKMLRELAENIKNYANKKEIDIDFIARY